MADTSGSVVGAPAALITRYYDGCSEGNLEILLSTLHPQVVHYFLAPNLGSAPVAGAEHLARYWHKVTRAIQARWVVDRLVVDGDEAVIEWTMFWLPAEATERVATRGAEWFVLRDGLIAEIRSYYQQRECTTQLEGFPYADRGYSLLEREHSQLHPEPAGPGREAAPEQHRETPCPVRSPRQPRLP